MTDNLEYYILKNVDPQKIVDQSPEETIHCAEINDTSYEKFNNQKPKKM